jgi:hypothetical protein
MFVIRGISTDLVTDRDTECFLEGYGPTTADETLLAYYRYAWAVQDIGADAEEAILNPRLGEESRRAAVEGFKQLFEPGKIVELARAWDPSPRA